MKIILAQVAHVNKGEQLSKEDQVGYIDIHTVSGGSDGPYCMAQETHTLHIICTALVSHKHTQIKLPKSTLDIV